MNNSQKPQLHKHIVMPSCLQLSLKTKWFKMTKAGIKTEDYREINEYWFKRLVFQHEKVFKYCTGNDWHEGLYIEEGIDHITKSKKGMLGFKPFENNIMKLDTQNMTTLQMFRLG